MPYQRNPSSIFSLPNYNVKESSNVNNFPSNTNMIPSHLNTSYQIIPVNPHLIKMLYPVSRALSHKTQHATRPTRITSLFPRLHLVSSRDRRSFHEKIVPLLRVQRYPTTMQKGSYFPPPLGRKRRENHTGINK
jgi:hypothetical protein